MVTVVQLHPQNSAAALGPLAEGLAAAEQALLGRALEFAEPMYAGQVLSTGEPTWSHALGLAASLASIGLDAPGRAAGILFAAPKHLGGVDALRERFGEEIAGLGRRRETLPAARRDARQPARAERSAAQDGPRHGRGRAGGPDPAGEPHADIAVLLQEYVPGTGFLCERSEERRVG